MLQRIQSVYLLLASITIYALFLFPLVHNVYAGAQPVTIGVTGVFQDVNGVHTHTQFFVGLTAATVLLGLIPLIIIFLYKNRKQQVALCYSTMLVIFGHTFWMVHEIKSVIGDAEINTNNWGIGVFLSTVALVFIVMAIKAINRDEKLVKSADRLR
jgi:Domain of unknown function (DUF4293)